MHLKATTWTSRHIGAVLRGVCVILAIALAGASAGRAQGLGSEQIDQLTAPIALYTDTLLAQVLIASTYPAEVAEAAQWAKQNANVKGAALDSALEQQSWDPSVKALVQVPTVLEQMNARMDWTQKLGDAFLAQQTEVMDSIQRLRQRAQEAGQLMTTEQQQVTTQGQTIIIEQADPQVIHVPSYNPAVVYGGWPYPSYPPYYWPTPPGYALASGLAWGAGFAIGAAVWDNAFDWNNGDINVNVNRNDFTNISSDRINNRTNSRSNWQHNAANRRGTNYRDTATRERFGKTNPTNASARRESRGFDQKQVANQLGQGRGSGQLGQQRGSGQLGQRDASQLSRQLGSGRSAAETRGRANSFDGVRNGASTRAHSDRGRSSRNAMAQNVSSRGGGINRGGGAARPAAASRGGGGRAAAGGARGGGGRGRR
jgi:hypothetical protein